MSSGPYAVPDDDTTPYPVDMERLQRVLKSMGYMVDVLVEKSALGAVFDEVPVLFTFDAPGRFLSVRSVWDTEFDATRTTRCLFAAADSWNREKYFPTVYSMTAPEGRVQVCADFVIDTGPGLTDVQLAETIGAGVSTGISAIDYMKQATAQTLDSSR